MHGRRPPSTAERAAPVLVTEWLPPVPSERGRIMARPFLVRWRDLVAASTLTPTQRAIAWRAADYANNDGSSCRPSSARLARDCGLSMDPEATRSKTVERALSALVALGLAEKEGVGYRGHAARYTLVIPGERGSGESPIREGKGDSGVRKGGRQSPPTCTQTYSGAAPDAPRRPARHNYRDDGSGQSCAACSLGPSHAVHREAAA